MKPVDIFSSLYTEKRINVQKDRSLNDIIIESQQLVQLIEFMVNNARQNNNYEPWMTMEERQQEFAKRPIYKPGLNLIWPNQSSATAAFKDAGWTIALRQRGTSYVYNDASKAQRIGLFWFPIIETREEADKHGRNWFNEISKDQKEIVEHYIGGKKNIKAPDTLPRITFKKGYDYYTNYSGNQYMGVYKYDPAISTLKERHYVLDENESEINLIVATKEKSSKKNGNNE